MKYVQASKKSKYIYALEDIKGFTSTVRLEVLMATFLVAVTILNMIINKNSNFSIFFPIIFFNAGISLNRNYWERKIIIKRKEVNIQKIHTSYWLKSRFYIHISIGFLLLIHFLKLYMLPQ